MNSITFTQEKRTYTFAGSFNELTRRQLIFIAGITTRNMDKAVKLLYILGVLLNVGPNIFSTLLFRYRLKPDHIVDMFPAAEFALEDPDLTKNLIPSFRIPYSFKRLYGPDDYLKNLVFIEFIKAENNFTKFSKTGKMEYLDKLVAILYRPQKKTYDPLSPEFDGDIREKYSDYNIEARAKKIAGLDLRVKMAIMMYYHGSRNFIIKRNQFRHVFTKEVSEKVNKSEGKYTWENVLVDVAGHVQYIDDVSYCRLYTVLILINDKVEKEIKSAEFIKKSKP